METEVTVVSRFIVHQGSYVHNNILGAEVLQDRELLEALFRLLLEGGQVYDRVNNLDELIVEVRHDKGTDTANREVEIIDEVSLLIEIGGGRYELLLHPTAYPGQEVLVTPTDRLEEVESHEAFLMDFFADLESEVHWKFVDEIVETSVILAIVLKRFTNIKE